MDEPHSTRKGGLSVSALRRVLIDPFKTSEQLMQTIFRCGGLVLKETPLFFAYIIIVNGEQL